MSERSSFRVKPVLPPSAILQLVATQHTPASQVDRELDTAP
jgi:hypothetical protein